MDKEEKALTELKCTDYAPCDDPLLWRPCQCPVCAGFLKWIEKDGELIPICNKCGTELIAIPDKVEDEELETGKICPISRPKINRPKRPRRQP